MNLDHILSPPVPLGDFVSNPRRPHGWLYSNAQGTVSLATPCREILVDSQELSEEDYAAQEEVLRKEGFRCLLSSDQIEDVISNLQCRYPHATPKQIEEALAFFVTHDAFIVT
jgi:hypothetical protein